MGKHIVIRLDLEEMLRSMHSKMTVPVLLLPSPRVVNAVKSVCDYLGKRAASYDVRSHGEVSVTLGAEDIRFLAAQDIFMVLCRILRG